MFLVEYCKSRSSERNHFKCFILLISFYHANVAVQQTEVRGFTPPVIFWNVKHSKIHVGYGSQCGPSQQQKIISLN